MKIFYVNCCMFIVILFMYTNPLSAQDNDGRKAGKVGAVVTNDRVSLKKQQKRLRKNIRMVQSNNRMLPITEKRALEKKLNKIELNMEKVYTRKIKKNRAEIKDIAKKVGYLNQYLETILQKNKLLNQTSENKLADYIKVVEKSLKTTSTTGSLPQPTTVIDGKVLGKLRDKRPSIGAESIVADERAELEKQRIVLNNNKVRIGKKNTKFLPQKEKARLAKCLGEVELALRQINTGEIKKTRSEIQEITKEISKLNKYVSALLDRNKLLIETEEEELVTYLEATARVLDITYTIPKSKNQEVIGCIKVPQTNGANPFHVVVKTKMNHVFDERTYIDPIPTTMEFGLEPGSWFIEIINSEQVWVFEIEVRFWYLVGIFERYEGKILSVRAGLVGEDNVRQNLPVDGVSCGFYK